MKAVSAEEAVAVILNGASVMVGGFMGVGTPDRLVNELVRQGKSELQKCALPLTSSRPVDLVVTDMAVIGFAGGRITLRETAPGVFVAEVIAVTEADLFISTNVPEMKICVAELIALHYR
jgi:acyl CoA:acetate/3-ketoacid CoA transferase beta subunit